MVATHASYSNTLGIFSLHHGRTKVHRIRDELSQDLVMKSLCSVLTERLKKGLTVNPNTKISTHILERWRHSQGLSHPLSKIVREGPGFSSAVAL